MHEIDQMDIFLFLEVRAMEDRKPSATEGLKRVFIDEVL